MARLNSASLIFALTLLNTLQAGASPAANPREAAATVAVASAPAPAAATVAVAASAATAAVAASVAVDPLSTPVPDETEGPELNDLVVRYVYTVSCLSSLAH
jgi:hypothetical protein